MWSPDSPRGLNGAMTYAIRASELCSRTLPRAMIARTYVTIVLPQSRCLELPFSCYPLLSLPDAISKRLLSLAKLRHAFMPHGLLLSTYRAPDVGNHPLQFAAEIQRSAFIAARSVRCRPSKCSPGPHGCSSASSCKSSASCNPLGPDSYATRCDTL